MKNNIIKYTILAIIVLIAGVLYMFTKKDVTADTPVIELDSIHYQSDTTESYIYVHICGQVNNPGVYKCMEGDRIFEVLELAGGITETAYVDYINMAQPVSDGMKIFIPTKEEADNMNDNSFGMVNINTATIEQLMTLSGIGESRAKDIIAYRDENGYFKTIEDIMKVPGIKEAAFNKIKDYISV